MAKVQKDESGCWLWTAAKFTNGYGAFKVRPKMWKAHRWIVNELRGPIPDGAVVMHSCDIRDCVNPDHLVIGSQIENLDDMTAKGRRARGDRMGSRINPPKLSRKLADEIRAEYSEGDVTQRVLATKYGVEQTMISRIVTGKSWTDQVDG